MTYFVSTQREFLDLRKVVKNFYFNSVNHLCYIGTFLNFGPKNYSQASYKASYCQSKNRFKTLTVCFDYY